MTAANSAPAKRLALALAIFVLAADQATKWLVLADFETGFRVVEVTGFFNLVLVYNRGISFGLFGSGSAAQTWLLIGISTVIVIALLFWLRDASNRLTAMAIGAVVGGAVGNIIDRLMPSRRAVVDFLDFHIYGIHWPAFNIADTAIVLGVVALLAGTLIKDRQNPDETADQVSEKTAEKERLSLE